MKKIYLFGIALISLLNTNAQSLSENFESRSVGDYMGVVSPEWTTWSGTVGGEEDVQVTDAMAFSGTNSIYFQSTSPSGGPQDVVVPFGGILNTGNFYFESKFYVEDNKGAYFNFQGTGVLGGMYSMNCQMVNDGRMLIDGGGAPLLETTFDAETWFTLAFDINLNTNTWEVLIDGVSQGLFSVENNQIASVDLYPVNNAAGGNNQAGYFMDDLNFEHESYVLPGLNLGVTAIENTNGLATTDVIPSVKVRNLGSTTINSFDVEINYNGETITKTVSGISLASLASYTVDFDDALTLAPGENDMVATVSNVNGGAADDDASDDIKTINLDPVVPAAGKVVVGEEATGTWCGWCPRGAVYLEKMNTEYPDHFIGIAVHNGDPMTYDPYDMAIGDYISGYPSMIVDRLPSIDPSAVEGDFLSQVIVAPKAVIEVGADYTPGSTEMYVSITADFVEAISGDYRIACVITEDDVTGTGSGYNQANYYAGGGAGVMGGYEVLSNPVPAADMVYDHVARVILPSFGGKFESFPASVEIGETHTVNFIVDVDPSWNMDNVHIIGLLIDPTSNIDNAGGATVDEAITNGYVGIAEKDKDHVQMNLFPNPANVETSILLNLDAAENVQVTIFDLNGKIVSTKNYGSLSGDIRLPINTERLSKGIYSIFLQVGDVTNNQKLVVQ